MHAFASEQATVRVLFLASMFFFSFRPCLRCVCVFWLMDQKQKHVGSHQQYHTQFLALPRTSSTRSTSSTSNAWSASNGASSTSSTPVYGNIEGTPVYSSVFRCTPVLSSVIQYTLGLNQPLQNAWKLFKMTARSVALLVKWIIMFLRSMPPCRKSKTKRMFF